MKRLRIGIVLAAGGLTLLASTPASAQLSAGFTCVGGLCDVVDMRFTAPTPQVFTSLTLTNAGFAGFAFTDLGFGGQINEVAPPFTDGLPGRFWIGVIGAGGTRLTTASCGPLDPSFPSCGPTAATTDMVIRVFFDQIPTLGDQTDFVNNFTYQVVDAGGTQREGRFEITVSAVPEPTTVALLGLGLVGVAVVSRARRTRTRE